MRYIISRRFNIDVRINTEITAINAAEKIVTAVNLKTGEEYIESYDKLVLSPGAEPIRPPLLGIKLEGIFTVRNVNDTDHIKKYINQYQVRKAAVIGAGFIGLEMAENLHGLGLDVSVIEMGNQILAPVDFPIAAIAQQHLREKGINLHLNTAVEGFVKYGNQLKVQIKDAEELETDIVILSTAIVKVFDLTIGVAGNIPLDELRDRLNEIPLFLYRFRP